MAALAAIRDKPTATAAVEPETTVEEGVALESAHSPTRES